MYYAVEKGFALATGEIMAWINSDDMYHRNAFNIVADIFCNMPDVEWLTGFETLWDDDDRTVDLFRSRYFSRAMFLRGDMQFIQQESTFWRRSLYDKVGGMETKYRLAGDFALWMKFTRAAKLYVVDALIGGFRTSQDGQLSDQMDKYMKEVSEIITSEPIDATTQQDLDYIFRTNQLVNRLERLTFHTLSFEWIRKRRFRRFMEEEQCHRIIFDRSTYRFAICQPT